MLRYTDDPKVLLSAPFDVLPKRGQSQNEKINAISRLIIYASIGLAVVQKSYTPLLLGATVLFLLQITGASDYLWPADYGFGAQGLGEPAEVAGLISRKLQIRATKTDKPGWRIWNRMTQPAGEKSNPMDLVPSVITRQFSTRPKPLRVEEWDPDSNWYLSDRYTDALTARVSPIDYIRRPPG